MVVQCFPKKKDFCIFIPLCSIVLVFKAIFSCSTIKSVLKFNSDISIIQGYDDISDYEYKIENGKFEDNQLAKVKKYNKWGFVNKKGKEIIPVQYEEVDKFHNGLSRVKKNGKYGYIDKTGKEIIPINIINRIDFLDNDIAIIEENNNTFSVIDKSGKTYDIKYDGKNYYRSVCGNSILFSPMDEEQPSSIINKNNEKILLKGEYVRSFSPKDCYNNLICMKNKDNKIGIIDETEKEIIPFLYDNCHFTVNYIVMSKNNEKIIFDKTGKKVTEYQYDYANDWNENLIYVGKNGKYGIIDKIGKMIIPIEYMHVNEFGENLIARKDNKSELFDINGNVIAQYQYIDSLHENFARITNGHQWGVIDKKGKEVIPLQYDYVHNFSNDLAGVRKNHQWGFIDKTGKEVISFQYDDVSRFNKITNFAVVKKEQKWGLIDKTGKEIIPIQYNEIEEVSNLINACNYIHPEQPFEKEGFQFKVISVAPQSGQVVVQELSTQEYFPTHCWEVPK